ncbi:Succinate-semialdehyde dehydrogenase [NADP(+)] [Anatilimnocola aggregata]|uniref:Succinate-semialdehyde dehydrogenase [NADP(+)] n=1 Tax=Anatilimnocola aggregata TaxID=2528021 RepID=A0A517YKI7_9BACT|nr:aldehyde dehydrogenase family protein [Anatilimnocola aggregata]QDU30742.1 Succinate-semialdehyde dehydrogenase [NADP(+)] [Anatilimnocola aggregata]
MWQSLLGRLRLRDINSGVYGGRWLDRPSGETIESLNPATGEVLARVLLGGENDYDVVAGNSLAAFAAWRKMPPPQRGEIVRLIGEQLRKHKDDLGMLVTLEAGKIRSEGLGEVQEMIDMCDFAVGLSRQLYGLTIASERPEHRLFEQWHPLGPVGVITAFNFPVAVWAWNAALALVCGDPVIWKPSQLTPLTAIAVQQLVNDILEPRGLAGVLNLCAADRDVGEQMAADGRLPLVSATGSTAMGKSVAKTVAERLGRSLLELGGNNGCIVTESADLDLALRAILFAAVGTAGQRCTTLRRLIVHESHAEQLVTRLTKAYQNITVGLPWEEGTLLGPLISESAVKQYTTAITTIKQQGGEVLCGGKQIDRAGYYVQPTIVRAKPAMEIIKHETFAPILYVLTYRELEEAIALHNGVPQGLSSAIFTDRFREAEQFLSPWGSDCGIANVNLGPSGAEIGGAFGGEKETGGGREAGSDAWKTYMRRQTCTLNFGKTLPLAQGVKFDVGV